MRHQRSAAERRRAPAGNFTRQDDGEGGDPGEGKDPDRPGGDSRPDDGGGDDGERDAPERDQPEEPSPLEARARELQWKMRLGAALEEEVASGGKTFGELPAWLEDLVQATIEPPPAWSATLGGRSRCWRAADRSFLRPSRRMSALVGPDGDWPEVVSMPGRRVVPAGRLVSVVDTSCSVDEATLARFPGRARRRHGGGLRRDSGLVQPTPR